MSRCMIRGALVAVVALLFSHVSLTTAAHAEGSCGGGEMPFEVMTSGSMAGGGSDWFDWWSTETVGPTTTITLESDVDTPYLWVNTAGCSNPVCSDGTGTDRRATCTVTHTGTLSILVANPPETPMNYTLTAVPGISSPTGPPSATCNTVNTGDVCVNITSGDVTSVYVLSSVVATHPLAGYVDAYRFALPTGGSVVLPCVVLFALDSSGNPCQTAGGTFVSRIATLVERAVEQPSASTGSPPLAHVCETAVTITVASFGVEEFPALALC